jgi:tetratricopeptide (TPR) repeat protein
MLRLRGVLARLLILALVLGSAGAVGWRWYKTTRPDYRLRQGQESLREGDWDAAEQLAERLDGAGYPDHAHLLRGEAFLRQGKINPAISEFNQIRDQGDLLVDACAVYGQSFLLSFHRPAEAERFLRFVVSRRADHIDAHRCLATIYYDQGAWVPAVLHLMAWGDLDRRDGRPYRMMGLIYKDLDQPTQAIPCYQEALRRELTDRVAEEVREELSESLVAQSHYDEALSTLQACGNRVAEEPKLLALRAECLWCLGRPAEARDLLDPALTRHPRCSELLRLRAKMHMGAGEPQAAVPLLERAVGIDRHDYASRFQLAHAYQALGRRGEAAEQLRRGQQTQDALKELTNLIKEAGEKPWDGQVRRRLADSYQRLDRSEAARWVQAAAACPPGPEAARQGLPQAGTTAGPGAAN